jgi:serine protease
MATDSITASYARISGTSMAAPFVTGVAALLWSSNPALTLSQVKNRILDRADILNTLSGKVQNSRRLNAKQVLTY